MAAKKTTVLLVSDAGGEREFTFEHAERLLRMPQSGWRVSEKTPYEFVENALHRRGNKGKTTEE